MSATSLEPVALSGPSGISFLGVGWGLTSVLVGLFILCYAALFVTPLSGVAHGWVRLFATEPQNVALSLLQGIGGSAGAAWIAALLFVPVYNKFLNR